MANVADLWTRTVKNKQGRYEKVKTDRYGKGKRWQARWIDDTGKPRSKVFERKVDAEAHAKAMETDVHRGDYFDPNRGKIIFNEVAGRWLSSRIVDPASQIRYEGVYHLHVAPEFARRQIRTITPSAIQAWIGKLSRTHGPSTIITAFQILQGVLDLAVADEALKKNPAKASIVQVPKWIGQKIVPWTDASLAAVIDAHSDLVRAVPVIGAGCGLRQGEIFGLALEDFDFEANVVRVRRQIKKLGSEYVYALPKNDRERAVPMSAWVAQTIQAHQAKFKPEPYSLPWEKPSGKLATHNLLFRWTDSRALRARLYNESVWRPALVTAGLAPAPVRDARGRKRFINSRHDGMHALRHYYASVLLADGVSVKELAEYLGHADPGFTLRTYIHMLPDSHERAIRAIDGRLFRPRAVSHAT
ncbi:tyrosine-type recombinase/integrase [Streptacidiphilus sp. MAP5-3]|uniref:tyrosine-type recombinase/integrase n=1 Tax=unclassified Streptacidiphilus TaxID=2643834 RepID=UPI003511B5A7